MAAGRIVFALFWFLPLTLAAQTAPAVTPSVITPSVIMMEEEPHHHLVLENDVVKVFEVDLAPRDAIPMHRHEYEEVFVVIGDATTVSTTPGQADILWMFKNGQVRFARRGISHSVRNIGQTAYRAVSIDLLRAQTNARNLCGNQIPDMKPNCPALPVYVDAPRADLSQFETDQMRATLTWIRPHQQASFGEAARDELIVTIDEAAIAAAAGKGPVQALAPGGTLWIARGSAKRILKNNSEKEARIVTVELDP